MGAKERRQLEKFYARATRLDDLPWHRREPPVMLRKVVGQRAHAGRALDIGCGAGTNAIYLARQGYEVTGVDFIHKPAQLTRERAAKAFVAVEVVETDIIEWSTDARFDLILDAGCLHGLRSPEERQQYRERIMKWLADDGDYVLTHFIKRHALDWRPFGPARLSRGEMEGFFAPELVAQDYYEAETKMNLPIGPLLLEGEIWFRRAARR